MRPFVWIDTGNAANADTIKFLPELLDFDLFDELEGFTELLLDFGTLDELDDFTELLLDFTVSLEDDEDFGTLDEDDFTDELLDFTELLLDCETLDEDDIATLLLDSVALEELETLEELELLGAVTIASKLSINLSETFLFNTGYLSLSDCVQAEPSNP